MSTTTNDIPDVGPDGRLESGLTGRTWPVILYGALVLMPANIYLLLVAIFTHWGYPWLIMTTIPLGIAGGIVGLALLNAVGAMLAWLGLGGLHQPFDMISMLGFLILMGTVVNNPILVVHRAVENFNEGAVPLEAVREAVKTRLRPIAMSTRPSSPRNRLPSVRTPSTSKIAMRICLAFSKISCISLPR